MKLSSAILQSDLLDTPPLTNRAVNYFFSSKSQIIKDQFLLSELDVIDQNLTQTHAVARCNFREPTSANIYRALGSDLALPLLARTHMGSGDS